MKVQILDESLWAPWLDAELQSVPVRLRAPAGAVMRLMHDRQVGITPGLAIGWAAVISSDAADGALARDWQPALRELERILRGPPAGRAAGKVLGFLPDVAPSYLTLRLALPLAHHACRRLGTCYLFGAHGRTDLTQDAYQRHHQDLCETLKTLAKDGTLREGLWAQSAFSLATLSRPQRAPSPRALPDLEPVGLTLLLKLDARDDHSPLTTRRLRLRDPSQRLKPRESRNEGGIDGIHRTHRESELGNMLHSELCNPQPILYDRLLNSGYLAKRRPPRRERRHAALILGLMPWHPGSHLSRALCRAAWVDCLLRFARVLHAGGFHNSELVWIEGDRYNRARSARARLVELAAIPGTALSRRGFLAGLRWLPDLLDGMLTTITALELDEDAQPPHQRWLQGISQQFFGGRSRGRDRPSGLEALAPEEFRNVQVMVFCAGEQRSEPATVRKVLGLPWEYGLGATWYPAAAANGKDWSGFTGQQPWEGLTLPTDGPRPEPIENRIAAGLLERWTPWLLREVLGV